LTFLRRHGNEEMLAVINLSNAPFFGSIEAGGNFADVTPNTEKKIVSLPAISLDAFGYRIFRKKI
jgi:hypothetical protein